MLARRSAGGAQRFSCNGNRLIPSGCLHVAARTPPAPHRMRPSGMPDRAARARRGTTLDQGAVMRPKKDLTPSRKVAERGE